MFVVVLIGMRMLQTMLSESVLVLRGVTGGKPKAEAAKPLGAGVLAALHLLRSSHKKRAGMFHEWLSLVPECPRPVPRQGRAACEEDKHSFFHSFTDP